MRRTHGFTLIELLVVVTIIVVLLAMLLPALDRAVGEAVKVRCLGNLKGVGYGLGLYLQDSKQRYPISPSWHTLFGAKGTGTTTDVTARPLNVYLGYTGDGADVPIAECPGDLGDFGANTASWAFDHAYTYFGMSYEIPYYTWSGIKGVFADPTPRASSLQPIHNKVLMGDATLYGNRPYSNPRNNWHAEVPEGADPFKAVRRHNVLLGDLRAEFFAFDNADIDEAVDPSNATQLPDPSRGWW